MEIKTKNFGQGATLITLTNASGDSISFTDFGARIVDWVVDGKNIVLGFDSVEEYINKDTYVGATIGRTSGRIKDAQVKISGITVQLNQNEGAQNLHGGKDSFESKLWDFEVFDDGREDLSGVRFFYSSPMAENGYPGNMKVQVTHTFDEKSKWTVSYEAISDADTVFNPTNHVYFNLNGTASQAIDNHRLQLSAGRFVPLLDHTQVVRGDILEVNGTAFDFTSEKTLQEALSSDDPQIALVKGIDHPFLLDTPSLHLEQARLSLDDLSISVYTDCPAIVIFTANFGNKGVAYRGHKQVHHGGITFETQVSPGAQQIPELGDITLKAGQIYKSTTIYQLNKG